MPYFHGKPTCECGAESLPWVEKVMLHKGLIRYSLDIYQLIGHASASANTHAAGLVVDSGQYSDEQLRVWRDMGYDASWRRTEAQGFDIDHHHGAARGCPHNIYADYQIDAVDAGYNGLGKNGRGGRDDGPRPLSHRTWQEGIEWAKGILAFTKPEPATTTGHLSDSRINESSWLALSVKYPGIAYTSNDENGPIFVIDRATGKTVGSFTLAGVTLKDPESGDVHTNGALWVADCGDNKGERDHIDLYALSEPGPGNHGPLSAEHYRARYSDGARNAEAFFVHPVSGHRYIISKEMPGALYRNDKGTLDVNRVGTFRRVGSNLPSLVTEAKFSPDGKRVYCRQKGKTDTVTVLDGDTFRLLGSFKVPAVEQPESLDTDGKSVWFGSEGANSPIRKVPIPAEFRPGAPPAPSAIDLSNQKLTTDREGPNGHALEVKQPQLDTYDSDSFHRMSPKGPIRMRVHRNGATTPNSTKPRTELREQTDHGRNPAKWSNASGSNTQSVTMSVTKLDKGESVVLSQIHGADDDIVMVRATGLGGGYVRLEAGLGLGKGKGNDWKLLSAKYRMDTKFKVTIYATRERIAVRLNNDKTTEAAWKGVRGDDWYFKAGAYLQSGEWAEILLHALSVNHTK